MLALGWLGDVHAGGGARTAWLVDLGHAVFAGRPCELDCLADAFIPSLVHAERPTDSEALVPSSAVTTSSSS